jgi:hypothetical protein
MLPFILVTAALPLTVISASVDEDKDNVPIWVQPYDGGGDDFALDTVADSDGNVFVGGVCWDSRALSWYYNILKYDSSGKPQWAKNWDSGVSAGNPLLVNFGGYSIAMGVDSRNNVIVCTMQHPNSVDSAQVDRHIRKFSPEGKPLWEKVYDSGGFDRPGGKSIAIDSKDNIISTGTSMIGAESVADTIKYSPDGTELWHMRAHYPPKSTQGETAAVDLFDNVIVGGFVQNGTCIIKYDSSGNELWHKFDPSFGCASITTDSKGNILLTGIGQSVANTDFYTTKYDSNGDVSWVQTYDSGNYEWGPYDIAVDYQGNITVVGLSYWLYNAEGLSTREAILEVMKTADYCAITYDSQGKTICKRTYDGGYGDYLQLRDC